MFWHTFHRDPHVQLSVKQNLETLLELKLPGPESAKKEVALYTHLQLSTVAPAHTLACAVGIVTDCKCTYPKWLVTVQGFCGDCGICYAYQLQGVVVDMVCNNRHCNQPFHFDCLLEVYNMHTKT